MRKSETETKSLQRASERREGAISNVLDSKTIMKSIMKSTGDEHSDWSYEMASMTFI